MTETNDWRLTPSESAMYKSPEYKCKPDPQYGFTAQREHSFNYTNRCWKCGVKKQD